MFVLQRFGTTTLPEADPAPDMGGFQTLPTGIIVAGGLSFDSMGTNDAPSQQSIFAHRASLLSNTVAALEAAYRALLALRGKVLPLYRQWLSSGSFEWINARLLQVQAQYNVQNQRVIEAITCTFESRSPHWNGERHGQGWTFDSGEYFDTGLVFDEATGDSFSLTAGGTTNFTLNNGGNVSVTDIDMKLLAGGTAITSVDIYNFTTNCHLQFTGSILFSGNLFIKTGEYVVFQTGVDAYADFGFGGTHQNEVWMELAPGDNSMRVILTGGGTPSIEFDFYDGWA